MLSRDADACFWIGRYVERAEATARMVDVHYHASLEAGRQKMHWGSLLAISGGAEAYAAHYGEENDRDALEFFAFAPDNPDSIRNVWGRARENARSIREQLSSEMWETLNVTHLELRQWDVERVLAESPHTFFHWVKNASHLFQGILNRTLMMGEARDWLDSGRFLERADQTARLLDVKYHDLEEVEPSQRQGALLDPSVVDIHGWSAALRSVSAFEMYRKTHRDGITPENVVGFLVLNPKFPASVRHGVGRVEGCLRRISGNSGEAPVCDAERLIGRLRADLTFADAREILAGGLHDYLEDVQVRCGSVGEAITRTYLSY